MNIEELDRSCWAIGPEPDIWAFDVNGAQDTGRFLAERISKDYTLAPDSKYLGLAAGEGYAELTLSRKLRLADRNVTLVDRRFYPVVLDRLDRDHPDVERIQRGMFAYLEDGSGGYSIASAIGIEYVLHHRVRMEALIRGFSNVLQPGGLACVFAYWGDDLARVWNQNGFDELHGFTGPGSLLLYALK